MITADLPVPKSSYLDRLRGANEEPDGDTQAQTQQTQEQRPATPPLPSNPLHDPGSTRSRRSRRPSLGGLEADPWASPDLHRGHNHSQADAEQSILNGFGNEQSYKNSWSDTREFENAYQQTIASNGERPNGRPDIGHPPPSSSGSGWGGSNTGATPGGDSGLGDAGRPGLGGFGSSAPGNNLVEAINPRRRSLGTVGRVTMPQVEETVTVTLLPEKEGLFMFQHRNYEIKSARRGSTVVRRYSDFVWLLDCLNKRYPFRQLPLLPPKRISGKFSKDPKEGHGSLFAAGSDMMILKSMALTSQRIPIHFSRNVDADSYGLRMLWYGIRYLARSSLWLCS